MVRERLINYDTHFDNDQVEAVMRVLEDSGYSDMYEALKSAITFRSYEAKIRARKALDKAEGK